MFLLLASDATREVALLIDCAECEAGFIAVQTWSWCCSRMAIEARARASVRTGGTGGRVAGRRGSGEAASGVLGTVGAVLLVRGGAGPCGMVLVLSALSSGGKPGGGGGGSCVGVVPSMVGPESETTGANVVQTTGPLGRDAGTGDSYRRAQVRCHAQGWVTRGG